MMSPKFASRSRHALLATGLLFGFAAAHAASGVTVSASQETLVKPGMTMAEVRAALGRPAQNHQYGNEPGPTLTYNVAGTDSTLFDVDFNADGTVLSVSERIEEMD